MQDNALIRLFLPIITSGLTADGYTSVSVVQSNQPTQQGINIQPTVYFFKLFDHRYGFAQRGDIWNADLEEMVHTEVQQYETTFQIGALVIQNPSNSLQFTASDLLNDVAAILQSDTCISTLEQNDVGILKIGNIINPYFVDDEDNFEASPSFDFTLTHKQTRVTTNPVIDLIQPGIYPI